MKAAMLFRVLGFTKIAGSPNVRNGSKADIRSAEMAVNGTADANRISRSFHHYWRIKRLAADR